AVHLPEAGHPPRDRAGGARDGRLGGAASRGARGAISRIWRRRPMMKRRLALAALLLAMTAAGCGKELVVGGQKPVEASGTGDGTPEGGASPSRAPAYDRLVGGPSLAATARAQGTITFDAKVEV